jgi:hypothetical protein
MTRQPTISNIGQAAVVDEDQVLHWETEAARPD